MQPEQYDQLNAERDWPFFDSECTMSVNERSSVWPLSEPSAHSFWRTYVSANPLERHGKLLPKGHWLAPTLQGPSWLTEQRDGRLVSSAGPSVGSFLSEKFSLDPSERVYFVLMREHAYSVPMGVFCSHWEDFLLLDDEAPFLFHPTTKSFACFGPNGSLSFGIQGSDSPTAP